MLSCGSGRMAGVRVNVVLTIDARPSPAPPIAKGIALGTARSFGG